MTENTQAMNNSNTLHVVDNLFCSICSSLYKRSLTENNCDICGNKEEFKGDVYYSEDIGAEKPDYRISINVVYDYTLPRVYMKCETCNDNKEFIIYQKNPSKYITNKICTSCLTRST